jgi:hypothetical protein
MQKCERGNNLGKQCKCAVVDEDDANALELPKNITVASTAPAQTQQAALPPQSAPSPVKRPVSKTELAAQVYDDVMTFALSRAKYANIPENGANIGKPFPYRALAKSKAYAICLDWTAYAERLASGKTVSGAEVVNQWGVYNTRSASNAHDNAISSCKKGLTTDKCQCQVFDEDDKSVLQLPESFVARMLNAPEPTKAAAVAFVAPAQTQQAALPPPSADPKAKWDGTWTVWMKKGRGAYTGTATIKNGHVSMSAQSGIYQMISEGDIDAGGKLDMVLKFRNQPESYDLSIVFKDDVAEGTWDRSYNAPVKWTKTK